MIGNLEVKMSATFIPDPNALIQEIDGLLNILPNNGDVIMTLKSVKALVVQASRTEYVYTQIDRTVMESVETEEYMGFVNDKLKTALGDRVIATIDPLTAQREVE